MKKFVSKEKLSKKKRKAIDSEKRIRWDFSPVSRVIPNRKKVAEKQKRHTDPDLFEK